MRCGFYEKEITPPLGDSIPGYFEPRITEDVWDRLYAKAAVFAGDNGTVAVLILDAAQMKEEFARRVAERVTEFTGIPADSLVIAATHTHYGIPLGDSFDDGYAFINEPDRDYLKVLERLAADTVILAWKRLEECTLSYAVGWEDTVAYCRDFRMKDGTIRTNPGRKNRENILQPYADTDPETPVLTVRNTAGKRIGALFTHNCHQDTVDQNVYSGDYSSEVSLRLKEAYGHDFVSIYLAGCSGDINHLDVLGDSDRDHREVGREVAKAVMAAMDGENRSVAGEQVAFLRRWVPIRRRKATPEQLEQCRRAIAGDPDAGIPEDLARSILGYESRSLPDVVPQPVQILRIGELWFIALPGEVYHVFGQRARAAIPGEKWLITQLSTTESSYFPTAELFGTAVYPVKLTSSSFLEPEAGDKLVETVHAMVREMR